MSLSLPEHPDLEHLKKQAKSLLRRFRDKDPKAVEAFGRTRSSTPRLADAQHLVARQYGFASWAALRNHCVAASTLDARSALEAAVRLDSAQAVRDVLARFPSLASHLDDAMPTGDFGATPLIAAANQHNRAMMDVLLDAGANINQRSHWWAGGFGVLDSAAEIDKYLVSRGATVNACDASRFGLLDRLEELVMADPDVVNARFGDGRTPLHVAASVDVARFLLEKGAQIDALDIDHESTPAQYLVSEKQDVVRFLVSKGCRTDILMAAALGDIPLVRSILAENPEAIWTTVSPRYFPMTDPRAGGTIYIWSLGKSRTPHAIARQFGHDDVVPVLDEHTPPELSLCLACEAGDDGAVASLLESHPDIQEQFDRDLLARLPALAELNNSHGVKLMLDAGWDSAIPSDMGITALHWAAFHGNAEMVRDLLSHGAIPNATDRKYRGTPFDWAVHGSKSSWHRETGDYPTVLAALSSAGNV